MLGLLIYCYATGTFVSRRIERLTHENVAVRLLCADRLATQAGRKLYAQRKQTIEPVFGIIPSAGSGPRGKAAMGFRRFSLRGLAKVRTEWTLVTLAYNLKRLCHMGADLAAA